jgi:hypothetical protein
MRSIDITALASPAKTLGERSDERTTADLLLSAVQAAMRPARFAEPTWLTVRGETKAVISPVTAAAEKITLEGDWLHCLCGNTPDSDGFYPCLPDGTEVEPDDGGPWGGKLYVCAGCGRIIDQGTLVVVGRRDLTADQMADAVMDVLAPWAPGIPGLIQPVRYPLIRFWHEETGQAVMPTDGQVRMLAEQIVTRLRTAL